MRVCVARPPDQLGPHAQTHTHTHEASSHTHIASVPSSREWDQNRYGAYMFFFGGGRARGKRNVRFRVQSTEYYLKYLNDSRSDMVIIRPRCL